VPIEDTRVEQDLHQLEHGPVFRFADWPNPEVPNWRAGVYTIWRGNEFVYVGMAGRSLLAGAHETPEAVASRGKRKGLLDRLNSHAGGRRSGDQFCVYVFDRLVLVTLTPSQIQGAADGTLSCDELVRAFIREHLTYRFVVLTDAAEARGLEAQIRAHGLSGRRPLLNPGLRPE
jgi:hypothetical protein